MEHLIEWADGLNLRLVIWNLNGPPFASVRQQAGEDWYQYERRRLAVPLKIRRQALGWSQLKLGEQIGVTKDSIQRWELVKTPPSVMAKIVWVQALGYRLGLQEVKSPIQLIAAAQRRRERKPYPPYAPPYARPYTADCMPQ